jgi:integrase
VAFAAFTGARANEIQAQRWEWIDWERGMVKVYTSKIRRGMERFDPAQDVLRSIPLWPQHRAILRVGTPGTAPAGTCLPEASRRHAAPKVPPP